MSFVFPSQIDVFGLVVVEALGAGLATVMNSAAGSAEDLAVDGENCLVVDGADPETWAAAIEALVLDEELRTRLGERSGCDDRTSLDAGAFLRRLHLRPSPRKADARMTDYASPRTTVRRRRFSSRRRGSVVVTQPLETGHYIVLFSLAAIISVRFFTEELDIVPRAANFIDVPLLLLVAIAAVLQQSQSSDAMQQSTMFKITVPFLMLATISCLINMQRVDVFPALTFVYGFLSPVAYYLATYRLWHPGRARALSNLLVGLAIVQFVTIVFIDLPKFARTRNPDFVSGTFGTNAYQLVFFLLVFIALVIGIVTFEPSSRVRFFALPFIAAAFLAIFLAQYRSLLLTVALSTLFIGFLVFRRTRGFLIAAAAASALVIALVVMIAYVPTNKFTEALDAIRNDPSYFIDSRLGPADDIYHLYGDDAAFPLVGTGPGTYSSRAWNTYSGFQSESWSNVAGPYVDKLMGGQPYHTDVSDKYVVPRLNDKNLVKYGTSQFVTPYSSYFALLAETGILAFFLLVGIYVIGFLRVTRAALRFATSATPGDPLPALVLATATAFFTLLQMAVFGNWWETARVTLPTWILLAVITRELRARAEWKDFPY